MGCFFFLHGCFYYPFLLFSVSAHLAMARNELIRRLGEGGSGSSGGERREREGCMLYFYWIRCNRNWSCLEGLACLLYSCFENSYLNLSFC